MQAVIDSARIEFIESTHTYLLDGRRVPSITQALKVATYDQFDHVDPAVLAQRAEVRTKHARYTAEVTTDVSWEGEHQTRLELNPAGTAIGSVWVVLPAGEAPVRLRLQELHPKQRHFLARLTAS